MPEETRELTEPTASGMPMLGLGTWQNDDPTQCANSVATALDVGYRHIDTAQIYENEAAVGDGIARATVGREEVFLATKVWIDNLAEDDVIDSTTESLEKLGTDYIDLLYVHWPARTYDPVATLSAFEQLVEDGRVERIGVSNFQLDQVAEANDILDGAVFANQIELHPLLPQRDLVDACQDAGVAVVAYSPLARGTAFDVPQVETVAEKHDATPAQVCLAWLRERGITAIPKATSRAHIRDNWQSLALSLDAEDMETIASIDRRDRRVDPGFAPW
jgi:2,5-diketo-D-gluconate reductase B